MCINPHTFHCSLFPLFPFHPSLFHSLSDICLIMHSNHAFFSLLIPFLSFSPCLSRSCLLYLFFHFDGEIESEVFTVVSVRERQRQEYTYTFTTRKLASIYSSSKETSPGMTLHSREKTERRRVTRRLERENDVS